MDFHEYANLFPMLDDVELGELADDIRNNGLHDEIVLYDGQILDGRNRYLACREANVQPRFEQYNGNDPLGFVVSKNLHRRHLTSSQRAVIALDALPALEEQAEQERRQKIAYYRETGQTVEKIPSSKSRDEAAQMFGTNPRYVSDAKKIAEEAPGLLPQIRAGELSISKAKSQLRRKERVERINEIAQNNEPLATTPARYPIVYADPPWRYEHVKTTNRAIENHYPTMTLDEICDLPVGDIATPDAMLFMWATNPKLAEAMQVIEAWGFTYRTNFVWVKDKIGMGYYARGQHELLLVARRGDIPVPETSNRFASVVQATRSEHSAKPTEFYEMIEAMYPEYDRIELFARQSREGWAAWGNQA